ncbi:unnamed protein product [Caenorhabditis auriculariae]|uniref:KASH domain-containing protein n=1 Tax=Caenorhabditis auriculariae TaxID=2777116 RepID=A0A8S1HHE5_9PELO|nr:unnamed protein product [Caenorhabditis auriculariae]
MLSEVELPSILDDMADHSDRERDDVRGVDIFLEDCSSLYNLILDSLHNLTSKTVSCEYLEEMANSLEKTAKLIVGHHPDVENTILLRLNTICSAMEQLRLRNSKKSCSSDSEGSTSNSRINMTGEVRAWLHVMEKKLDEHEIRFRKGANLTKLLADQQVVQLEIQSDGQLLINRLFQNFSDFKSEEEAGTKRSSSVKAIRKRWHTIYLNSLSLQFRIEDKLNKTQEAYESESDPELGSPPPKRVRRSSLQPTLDGFRSDRELEEEVDVLPFAESEYESIMDGRTTVTSFSSEDRLPTTARKWDSVQQDIGYSSGENSVHEAMNSVVDIIPDSSEKMRRRRIESSPVKAFYSTVQLEDMSDLENPKVSNDEEAVEEQQHLSDSMYVNHDSLNNTLTFPEYDEVMAMFDEDLPCEGLNDSFHTKWRAIASKQKTSHKKGAPSREHLEQLAKSSCDASSENSSDCDESRNETMNCSFNSACFDTSSPLKRQRSGRSFKSSSVMLESLEMDASFCSTRSEMLPPCKSRSLRKKLRVRRMPRSMSDGEQLGICSGSLTPMCRMSPPSTPLARSTTRLLQKLDDELRRDGESDTAPEQSDAQVYEWDEYNPPAKDDSIDDANMQSRVPEHLLNVDDDFAAHFGSHNALRLVEESKAHLKIVHRSLETGDLNVKQMQNIELIVRTNLRQVESALKFQTLTTTFEAEELRDLQTRWAVLFDQMVNPVPQILSKVERFATSLRVLHDSSAISALNGVTEIKTREDVRAALDGVREIEHRLSSERDELREMMNSSAFGEALNELSMEFETISSEYDEAVTRINGLACNLDNLNTKWQNWTDRQSEIRRAMARIEGCLAAESLDQNTVFTEMEHCQERMNSLETVCNYLTSSLRSLQTDFNDRNVPDFRSELSIYSNALAQLRSRINEVLRVPTPPSQNVPQEPTPRKRRVATQTATSQTTSPQTRSKPRSFAVRLFDAVSSSRLIQATLALAIISAFTALFYFSFFGRTFGPHITYVNGPPPV